MNGDQRENDDLRPSAAFSWGLGIAALLLLVLGPGSAAQGQGIGSGRMASGFGTSISGPNLGGLNVEPNPGRIPKGSGFRPPPGEGRGSLREGGSTLRQVIATSQGSPIIIEGGAPPPSYNAQTLQRIRQRRLQQRRVVSQAAQRSQVRAAQHGAAHTLTLGFPADTDLEVEKRTVDLSIRARSLQKQLATDNLSITVEGDKAVLRGVVENDAQKTLVRRIVLLEPGIYEIDDQLDTRAPPEPEN